MHAVPCFSQVSARQSNASLRWRPRLHPSGVPCNTPMGRFSENEWRCSLPSILTRWHGPTQLRLRWDSIHLGFENASLSGSVDGSGQWRLWLSAFLGSVTRLQVGGNGLWSGCGECVLTQSGESGAPQGQVGAESSGCRRRRKRYGGSHGQMQDTVGVRNACNFSLKLTHGNKEQGVVSAAVDLHGFPDLAVYTKLMIAERRAPTLCSAG